MKDVPREFSRIRFKRGRKNPRWIKVALHIIIICTLLEIACGTDRVIYTILGFAWVIVGAKIQDNTFIVSIDNSVLLLFLVVMSLVNVYDNIIKVIQWISSMHIF